MTYLPTNNKHVEFFEKILTGDLSCVNPCSSLDTKILLPNFENLDNENWKDCKYTMKYIRP